MNKHTEAPWHVFYPRPFEGEDTAFGIGAPDRNIGSAWERDNAILMAAAPDLLAALQLTVARLEFVSRNDIFNTATDAAITTARAAIATAQGD